MSDARPEPKPRQNALLWQSYLLWDELMLLRQRHQLRLTGAERGKSNFDASFEETIVENITPQLEEARVMMINYGKASGPIWAWLTSIKGLGAGGEAAKLVAMVDDIGRFDTVAKLWRHAGYGLYPYWHEKDSVVAPKDGWQWRGSGENKEQVWVVTDPKPGWELRTVRDRLVGGWVAPYNKKLKSCVYLIVDQFMKQNTPYYREIYDTEKERQRSLHPDLSDMHTHRRAMRYTGKEFLKDLWVEWRTLDGLPLTEAY